MLVAVEKAKSPQEVEVPAQLLREFKAKQDSAEVLLRCLSSSMAYHRSYYSEVAQLVDELKTSLSKLLTKSSLYDDLSSSTLVSNTEILFKHLGSLHKATLEYLEAMTTGEIYGNSLSSFAFNECMINPAHILASLSVGEDRMDAFGRELCKTQWSLERFLLTLAEL